MTSKLNGLETRNTKQLEDDERNHNETLSSIRLNKSLNISDIQWYMLDKNRFFPLTLANMFCVRTLLYPLTLVRTRLQIQSPHKRIYTGTFNALHTVVKYEGFLALYKGFLITNLAIVPHVFYITTYEKVRHEVSFYTKNVYIMSFVGGAAGSIAAQVLTVPIDILSQHMMLSGQKGSPIATTTTTTASINSSVNSTKLKVNVAEIERIHVPDNLKTASNLRVAQYITGEIYKTEGMRGFYRGYFLSTFLVSFNSALWWPFYYWYQGKIRKLMPDQVPTLLVQCLSGPLSSFSANFITNPLDVMRTNMQISKRKQTSISMLKNLWQQDGYKLFIKGLTARLSYSCFYSFFIILGYETVKKVCLKQEYHEIYYSID